MWKPILKTWLKIVFFPITLMKAAMDAGREDAERMRAGQSPLWAGLLGPNPSKKDHTDSGH
jgi:hypothetical protein